MRYRILGPLEVQDGAREVPLGQGRRRLLLAVLLLHPNQALSSDRLIDALWGESPPPSAARSLHNHVSALRKALGHGALLTRGHGYELRVGDDELDARRFAELADGGRAALDQDAPEHAARLLREALDVWRGEALADLAYEPAVQADAARLEGRRLEAIEDRIDADLALGRHADVLIELAAYANDHPTRERIRGQQMLALYRCGRQVEALAVYDETRRRLVHELGIEPGPALRRLERAILEHDPALGSPDALPAVPRAPRRRARPAVLLAVGGAILAGVLASVLLARGSPRPSTGLAASAGDAVVEIDPATNRVVGEYPVGGTPTVVSAAHGAVWTINADAQTVSRLDQRSGTVRTSATDSIPLDLAASSDGLWVLTGVRTPAGTAAVSQLARLDPVSGHQLAAMTLRPSSGTHFRIPPQLVAVGSGATWAIGRTGWLHRIDARTGATTIRRTPAVEAIATGAGQVWARVDGPRGPRLSRLDPRTGAVATSVDVPATGPGALAVGVDAVWLTDAPAGALWRIDTGGQPVVRTVPLQQGVDGVALGAGGVWASNSLAGTVTRVDPATNAAATPIAVGNTPRSLVISYGRVWVTVAGGGRPVAAPAGTLRPGTNVIPLRSSACGPVLTGADGRADVLIGSELPLGASARSTTQSMSAAVAFVLREHRFRAGRFRVALQTCDDATAQSPLPYDEGKCQANAKAYAANRSVVGVVGPMNSGCTFQMLPILNRAAGGPLALVSPTNSAKGLVRPDRTDPAGQLASLYPAGQRGYARIMPTEDYEVAALALMARRLGHGSAFYLQDAYFAQAPFLRWFRHAARRIGLRIIGTAIWDPAAKHYRRIAEQVRASGAQIVVVGGSLPTNAGPVIRDLRAALGPGVAIIAKSDASPISQLFAQAGPGARGVYVSAGGPLLDRSRPAGRDFARAFGATRPDGRVSTFDAYAATATEVLLAAIAHSDGTRASVSRALATTRLPDSPIGPIAFTRSGEPSRNPIAFARATRDLSGSIPLISNDVTGGEIEGVITPPATLITNPPSRSGYTPAA